MKKFILCFCALIVGVGAFAQKGAKAADAELAKGEAPKEIVTTTTEEVYEEITPEKEAEELVKMMTETTELEMNKAQKEKIYKVVLEALKEKMDLEPLREKDAKKHAAKEMEIFKAMNDDINAVIQGTE